MKQFYTREKASLGVVLPLFLPDGTASGESFTVRGIDSDEFRAAEAESKRQAIEIAQIKDIAKRDEAVRDCERELIASLVISWTFDLPCTHANVVNFFREAPQIAIMVNRFAANRAEFFRKKQKISVSGQKAK